MKYIRSFVVLVLGFYLLISISYTATSYDLNITPSPASPVSGPASAKSQEQKIIDRDAEEKNAVGRQADMNFVVKSLKDGKYHYLSDFKGKVIFLNFWATWCPPCRDEMPSIQSLYNMATDEEMEFLCVSDESEYEVSKFIREKGYTFPIYTYNGYPPYVFASSGIPATYIIGRDGKIAAKHIGGRNWTESAHIRVFNQLLGKKPPANKTK